VLGPKLTLMPATGLALLLTFSWISAQPPGGPPPEVKERIQAFTAALNSGSSDRWEKMAAAHFGKTLLARLDEARRRQLFESLRADFGTVTVGQVTREGPEAPLRLQVTGSNGQRGVIELALEPERPFLIAGIGVDVGGAPDRGGNDLPPPSIDGSMGDEDLALALDTYLARLAEKDVFSGVALVAKDGAAVFERAYGFADRAHRVPNTPATRFNLGSINKIFTQTAIEQLVAAGRLRQTDTLGALLPDYPQAVTRAATVDQLLRHTAGIADFFGEEFQRLVEGQVPQQRRLLPVRVQQASAVRAGRPKPVLQRLLHHARGDHREGLGDVL
jgi:hypothetical protein